MARAPSSVTSRYTVDLLGRALFRGPRDPSILMFSLDRDPTAIFLYNAFHLVMSLGIGLVVTSLIEHAERHPSQALVVVIMIIAGGVLTAAFQSARSHCEMMDDRIGYVVRSIRQGSDHG